MEFQNKVVLITGASRGIGRGLALAFGKRKAKVVVNYLKSKKEAKKVTDQIKKLNGQAVAVKADVSKRKDVDKMVKKVLKEFDRIDVLINNTGVVHKPADWRKVSEANFRKTWEVNLTGTFNCIKEVAPIMLKQKSGKIVNIASLAGVNPGGARAPAYTAAKAGVINLTKAFAQELAPCINVNAVAPSWVRTDWHIRKGKRFFKMVEKVVPMKRIAEIEDIVQAVFFLVSDKANFITGQTLIIDGGVSLG